MNAIAVGFWGAFLGSAALMLIGAAVLFARGMKRAAFIALIAAVVPVFYVLPSLGWLALSDRDAHDRLLAHINVLAGTALAFMLLSLLGRLRLRRGRQRPIVLLCSAGALVLIAGWALPAFPSLILSCSYSFCLGVLMLIVTRRYAKEHHRLAKNAVAGVATVIVAVGSMSMIGILRGDVPWPVHAVAAMAGIGYVAIMAAALWSRVTHMIELRQVMALGPSYDTVTRMPAHGETGKVVGAFLRKVGSTQSVGVLAVSIANLRALESLHGRAAQNHALYVCASRLRSCAPMGAQLCRLGEDGFMALINSPGDSTLLRQLARQVRSRMLRPIGLSIDDQDLDPDANRTEWMPEIGVGIALSDARVTPGHAVATARAISRTAWGYSSRMAWSESNQEVTELALQPEDSTHSQHSSGMSLG